MAVRPSRRAVALVTVPAMVFALAGLAGAGEQAITARPSSAPSGTEVTVAGRGYAPLDAVYVNQHLAAANPPEVDALWSGEDGLTWEVMFRESEPTPFSLGIRPVVFDRHLLLIHGDLARRLSLWRYPPEIPVAPVPTVPSEAEGRPWIAWIGWAIAIGGLVGGFTWLLTRSLGPGRRGGTPPLPRGV